MSFVSSPLGPDAYWVGETIEVAVDFSEPVIVTTGVRASLEVGTETRTMHYLRGTETGVVSASGFEVEDAVFGYVVVAADADDDGVDVPANALARQGDPSRGQLGPFWIHLEDGLGRLRLDTAAVAGGAGHAVDRADIDARLGSLHIGSLALVPPFDPDVTAYAADAGDEGIVTVTAEPVFAPAALEIAPLDARVGIAGHQVALAPGANTVEVTVTSADGSVTSTYTVDVTRTGRALVSNHGRTLRNSPAQRSAQPFTTGGHAGGYVLRAVQVRLGNPVPSSGDALVRIFSHDGGPDTGLVTLVPPASFTADAVNTFTAPAGTRLAPDTTYYVVTTNAADTAGFSVGVTTSGTEDSGAAAGWSIGDGRYTKGSGAGAWQSRTVAVMIGIQGTVGARPPHDDPTLRALSLAETDGAPIALAPAPFDGAVAAYTALAPQDVDRVTLRAAAADANATLAIAGDNDPATPGEAVLALVPGANVLTVAVTAEDGAAAAAYTVTVDRAPPPAACPVPNDWCATMTAGRAARTTGTARVEELGHAPGLGALSPATFAFNTLDYRVARVVRTVETDTAAGTVLSDVLTLDAGAALTEGSVLAVDGAEYTLDAAAAGASPGEYRWDLSVHGPLPRWAERRAVTVSLRLAAPSTDASLSALRLEDRHGVPVVLSPEFDPATGAYAAPVHFTVDALTLSAAASHAAATVAIAGDDDPATPGEAVFDLAVGAGTFTVTVTAQDRTVTRAYAVTVTRAAAATAPPPASLDAIWSAQLSPSASVFSPQADQVPLFGAGNNTVVYVGCWTSQGSTVRCSDSALLSDDTFSHYGTAVRIVAIGSTVDTVDNRQLVFLVTDVPLSDLARQSLVLAVDGLKLPLSDAAVASWSGGHFFAWPGIDDSRADWVGSSTIALELLGRSQDIELDTLAVTAGAGGEVVDERRIGDRYYASVLPATESITLAAAARDAGATLVIAGDDDPATPGEAVFDLDAGTNDFEVRVTAADGYTARTWPLTVFRHRLLGVEVVSAPAAGDTYALGEQIVVEAELTAVGPTAGGRVDLQIGDHTRQAHCGGSAGGVCRPTRADPKLRLTYTLTERDGDADGIGVVADSLSFASVETDDGTRLCPLRDPLDPACAGFVEVSHPAQGPLVAHKVEARSLWVSVDDAAAVVEGNAASFPVRLPYPAAGEVTVQWSSADGTAAAGADYTAVAGATLTIAQGGTAATITVQTLDDAADEAAERFTVELAAPTGGAALDPEASVAAAVVEDDDAPPSLAVADARAVEGEDAVFEATLSPAPGRAVPVTWSSADVTATAGADYTAVAGAALTFAAGETSRLLTVETLTDADDTEGDETFGVTVRRAALAGEPGDTGETAAAVAVVVEASSVLGAPVGLAATVAGARAIDLDWTAPAAGTVTGYRIEGSEDGLTAWSVLEADTGSTVPAWTDTGLAPAETRHYRVRALGAGGAAGPASDVAAATTHHGVLGIEVLSRPASGDTYAVGEQIVVAVEFPTTGDFYSPRLRLEIGGATRELTFEHCLNRVGSTVICNEPESDPALKLAWTVTAADTDADGIGFPANAVMLDEIIAISNYGGLQGCVVGSSYGGCSYYVDLSNEALGPLTGHKVEGRPLSVSVAAAAPAAEGGAASFPVRLLYPAAAPVTVTWSTADDTATAGEDYTGVTGATLTFAPGETEKHAVVTTLDDALDEAAERFAVTLDAATGAVRLDPAGVSAAATVEDGDAVPALAVTGGGAAEGLDALFEVSLSEPSGRALAVTWSTADGTATAGDDYTAVTATALTFAPGETGRTLTVRTLTDADDTEGEETFTVTVSRAGYPGEADAGETVAAAGTVAEGSLVPGAPTDLAAQARGARRIDLSWTAPAGAVEVIGYRIERWDAGSSTSTVLVPDTGSTATGRPVTGLAPGEAHDFRVRALGAVGAGPAATLDSPTATWHGVLGIEVVSRPASGDTYTVGERVEVAVELSAVGEVRDPRLRLDVGGEPREARCLAPDAGTVNDCTTTVSSPELKLAYTVTAADVDADGVVIPAHALALGDVGVVTSSGSVCAPAATDGLCGARYDLSHAALGPLPAHKVDGHPLRVSVADAAPAVEGGAVWFRVRLSYPPAAPVTVRWSSADGTATAGEDYTAVTGATLTFAPGETEKYAVVTTLDDALDEDAERFTVALTAATGRAGLDPAASAAAAAIEDDDAPPSLAVTDSDAGAGEDVLFEVSLSAPSARALAVTWSTADGTATAGDDYTAVAGATLTFAPGRTSAALAVQTRGGGTASDETFTVTVRRAAYPGEPDAGETVTATGTIVGRNRVAVSGLAAEPTAPGRIDLEWRISDTHADSVTGYRVEGSADAGATWSVLVSDTGSTATRWAATGLAPGRTWHFRVRALVGGALGLATHSTASATTWHAVLGMEVVSRPAFGDLYAAGERIVVAVELSAVGRVFDPVLQLDVGGESREARCLDPVVHAGGVVCMTSATAPELMLAYTVAGADGDADGVAVPAGALTLSRIETGTQRICSAGSADPTCTTFFDDSGAALGPFASHKVKGRPLWVSVAGAAAVTEGGAASFPVRLAYAAPAPVTVTWSSADDTAAAGEDYTAVAGATLTIAQGGTGATITVQTLDDAADEAAERFTVELTAAAGGARLDPEASVAAAVVEDDDAPPSLAVADARAAEGEDAVFEATLSPAPGRVITVMWSTVDVTATAGADYTAVAGAALTFAAGETSRLLTVRTLADADDTEGEETFGVTVRRAALAGEPGDTGETAAAVGTVVVPSTAPGAPTRLAATAAGARAIDLDWTAPQARTVTGYRIEGSEDGLTAWSVLEVDTGSTVPAWTATGLAPVETRHYRVRALGAGGVAGPASDGAAATTHHGVLGIEVLSRPASGDTYAVGEQIEVAVEFSTTGDFYSPRLRLEIGGATRELTAEHCLNRVGSTVICNEPESDPALKLAWTVTAADADTDGIGFPANAVMLSEIIAISSTDGAAGCVVGSQHGGCAFYIDLSHEALGPLTGHKVAAAPFEMLDAAPVTEGGTASFPVRLTSVAAAPVTVTWSTADDTATAGEDYLAVAGATLTFAPGETQKHAVVTTLDDAFDEAAERFEVTLDAATGVAVFDPTGHSAAATVEDDDAVPALAVTGESAAEGLDVLFEVSLSAPSARALAVTWSTADGTAAAGDDYTAVVATALTFAPGETGRTLTVRTLTDADDTEGEETFTLTVSRAGYPGEADAGETVTAAGTVVERSLVPGAPRSLSAQAQDARRIDLSWTAPAGAPAVTGYRVHGWDAASSAWTVLVPDTGSAATSWPVTGLGPGETHYFQVRALSAAGAGPPATLFNPTVTHHGVRGIEVVSRPASGDTYGLGERVEVAVELSAVGEVRNPRLQLDIGGEPREARCLAPDAGTVNDCTTTASSPELELAYTVTTADVDADGVVIPADALALPSIGIVTSSGSVCAPGITSNVCGARYDLSHAALGPLPGHKVDGPVLWVSVADAQAVEGGAVSFPVRLTYPPEAPVTVQWSSADGTAAAGEDYTGVTGATLTFEAGETEKHAVVQTLDDAFDEAAEGFTVALGAVTGADGLDPAAPSAQAVIEDDDAVPSLDVTGARAVEGYEARFEVSLSAPSARALAVTWSTADGTATAGPDYTAAAGALDFAPGETHATLTVRTLTDTDAAEDDEAFTVDVTRAPYAGEAADPGETVSAAGTVVEATSVPGSPTDLAAAAAGATRIGLAWTAPAVGPAVGAAATGYRVEGSADGGATWTVLASDTGPAATAWTETGLAPSQIRHYRVWALGAAGVGGVSNVASAAAAAEGGAVVRVVSSPESGDTYAVGEAIEVEVALNVLGGVHEPRLTLLLGSETREARCWIAGTVCVTTAAVPRLRLVYTVVEGDADADGIEIPADALSLGSGGIETAGGDRICQVGGAPPGCDGFLDLSHAALGPLASHKVEARRPRVSVADAGSVTEGNAASFPVRLPYAAAGPVTVQWSTADGTATAGEDYTAVTGATLTIAAGATAATIEVQTTGNALDEAAAERFTVALGAVTGAEGLDPAASVAAAVIEDDDPVPGLSVTGYDTAEGAEVLVDVSLSGPSARALAVTWSTADGTAAAGDDYTAVGGAALTFAPGETMETLTVQTLADDDDTEGDEAFTVIVARAAYPGEAADTGETVSDTVVIADTAVVPAAPRNPRAKSGTRRIDLTWTAPAAGVEVIGYRVEGSVDGGADWTVLAADLAPATRSWSAGGLGPNETRHLRVRALGARGAGPASDVASAATHHGVRAIEVVSAPAAGGVYRVGEKIVVEVDVTAIGTFLGPRLALRIGGGTREARCRRSDSGTVNDCTTTATDPKLELSWTVAASDVDADGIEIPADSLTLDAPGIGVGSGQYVCKSTLTDPGGLCVARYELSHAALGPLAAHAVEGRTLWVSVADAEPVTEGGAAAFEVRLAYPGAGPVTVGWSTADDTAVAGEDYTAVAAATLTFAPGETAATITVQTLGNALDEADRRFTVALGAVTGAQGLDPDASAAAAVVEDDDAVPLLSVGGARAVEGEPALFAVSIPVPSARAVTAVWWTGDDTATAGDDYTSVARSTLTLAPGETRATIEVETLADAAAESDEAFEVTVIRVIYPDEAGAGQTVFAAGTIVDSASVPAAPTDLGAAAAGARRIDLDWTAPATGTVTGYRIEGSGDGGATWAVLEPDTASDSASWSDTGLAPRETRQYRVRALGAHGAGPASAPAGATTWYGVLGMEIVSTPVAGDTYALGERIVVAVELGVTGNVSRSAGSPCGSAARRGWRPAWNSGAGQPVRLPRHGGGPEADARLDGDRA